MARGLFPVEMKVVAVSAPPLPTLNSLIVPASKFTT
jgi:hypothetical protein